MCIDTPTRNEVLASQPRVAAAAAVDPIALQPVDDVTITTLVDNSYDALLAGDQLTTRASFGAGVVAAEQFTDSATTVGMMAEHGFSALVTVRRGDRSTSVLFDTGLSPDAMIINADRLGVDLSQVQAVVLSHGHFDHAGGLAGLARRRGPTSLPMVVHPLIWTPRRVAVPGTETSYLPTLSRRAIESEGISVIERREPSLLVDGSVLITGEVDRTTEFERGMPATHEAWSGESWRPDPLVLDDQALVVNLRGKGLVIVTGCAHAGAVNIVRHAARLVGVPALHALVGGLHLSGAHFEPVITPTVTALAALTPELLVTGHCTGWRGQVALATAFPTAWRPGSSGSSYRLTAA